MIFTRKLGLNLTKNVNNCVNIRFNFLDHYYLTFYCSNSYNYVKIQQQQQSGAYIFRMFIDLGSYNKTVKTKHKNKNIFKIEDIVCKLFYLCF